MCASTAGSRSSPPSASAGIAGQRAHPEKTSMLASNSTIRAAPTLRRRKPPMTVLRPCPYLYPASWARMRPSPYTWTPVTFVDTP